MHFKFYLSLFIGAIARNCQKLFFFGWGWGDGGGLF